jgi:type VI protein secretion system component Hcp
MAFDYFLQVQGVDGESRDRAHVRWIECQDAQIEIRLPDYSSYGSDNPPDAGSTIDADSNHPQALRVRAHTSQATPRLMALADAGTPRTATFEAMAPGDPPKRVYRLAFTGAQFARVQTAMTSDGFVDTYDLVYQSVDVTFWPRLANGSLGTAVTTTLASKT